ncbi:MAG: CRTAC1 family protein [Acidobacteriota bacterium]
MSTARLRLTFPTAAFLLCLTASTSPSAATGGDDLIFTDIAAGDGAGITYRRQRSPSDAVFDLLKQQPLYTFPDLLVTPLKSRGAPGVAIFDYDRDGDQDLYVTNGPGADNSLYANQLVESGTVTFLDVAVAAGVDAFAQDSNGVCYGDVDNDGDHDLLVLGNLEPNRFFENQGDGTFLDQTAASGLGGGSLSSTSCTMGDVDGDGLLDVFVGNALDMSIQVGIFVEPFALNQPNQLFRNQGGNVFTEDAAAAGLLDLELPPAAPPGASTITWAVALVDLDLDGDLDAVQADDQAAFPFGLTGGIDRGYIQVFDNDGTGQFANVTAARGLDTVGTWMGLAFGDFDHNGLLDVFGSNFGNHAGVAFTGAPAPITFDSRWFLQNPDGTFADPIGNSAPANTPFGWGASAADYDNDGDTDILFHGGLDIGPIVACSPGVIFDNDGAAQFSRNPAALADSTDHNRRNVQGMAVGDLDDDGFVDIVSVSNYDMPEPIALDPAPVLGGEFDVDAFVLRTFLPIDPANFIYQWSGLVLPDGTLSVELSSGDNGARQIQVETLGTIGITSGGGVNRDGIGAVIQVTPKNRPSVLLPVLGGSSYASQDSLIQTAGLGSKRRATVEVLWPGGIRNRIYNVKAGTRLLFPEIPCSFDDPSLPFGEYLGCVAQSLHELHDAGVLNHFEKLRFFAGAIRAFFESH